MASSDVHCCQVCQIVTGEVGDMDYMFPGSDDDLDMEDTGMIHRDKQVARVKQMQK